MTAKRYSLGEIGCYRTKLIVDNETKHEMGNSVVVKRLNALHEENTELKSFIKKLTNKNGEIILASGVQYRLRKKFNGEWVK